MLANSLSAGSCDLLLLSPLFSLFYVGFYWVGLAINQAEGIIVSALIWCVDDVWVCVITWTGMGWGCPCDTCTAAARQEDYFLSHMHAFAGSKRRQMDFHARRACARMHSHIFFFHSTLLFNPPSSIGFWFPYLWSNWPVEMEFLVLLPCCCIRIVRVNKRPW